MPLYLEATNSAFIDKDQYYDTDNDKLPKAKLESLMEKVDSPRKKEFSQNFDEILLGYKMYLKFTRRG